MAKLADFGGAIFEKYESQGRIYGGTVLYKAPELVRGATTRKPATQPLP
jgi:hypothetical protein